MKFETFSVVVGDKACDAGCKFCVSRITCNKGRGVSYNYKRLETAIRLAKGFDEVIITGVGEPTLDRTGLGLITQRLHDAGFPIITLQTNGMRLAADLSYAKELYEAGLSRVALSVCSLDPSVNKEIMAANIPDTFTLTRELSEIGLSTRLSVIATQTAFNPDNGGPGVSAENMVNMLDECAHEDSVDQVTMRELGGDTEWIKANFLGLRLLETTLQEEGAVELLRLPYGARVYDYLGQNVAMTNCLTETTDPNQQRQLIYFPTGKLAFSWQHKGATLL